MIMNDLQEIWIDVPGCEGLYQVSNYGQARSLNYRNVKGNMHVLVPVKTRDGYLRVRLTKNGKILYARLNRLVWSAFNGPIPEGMQVNHINEDKEDNRLENLNLMTPKENTNWGTGVKRRKATQTNKNKSKRVQQFDLNGNFIAEFPSTKEVERQLGFSNPNISNACRNKYKQAYGYKWKYIA